MSKSLLLGVAIAFTTTAFSQTDSSAFFLNKGLDEKDRGRRAESLKQFEKAYQYNKNSKEVISELAAAYLDLRKYAQAKEKFLTLETMGEKTDSTYRQLMLLSFSMRQFDDAIKYASALKRAYPAEKTAYYLGKSFYEKDDLGNAIKYLDIAAKENPENADIPYTVARSYSDMQNFAKAIPYFQKAVELNPTQNRWIYEMALIYYGMNDDKNSLKYMLLAAEKGYKKDNEYTQNLATAYLNAGQPSEGIAMLKELLARRPNDKALLNSIAEAYYNAKMYDDAIASWDVVLQNDKKDAEALYMIGVSYQKKGEKEKGMAICDKAIEMDPSLQGLKKEMKMPGNGF
ncbi:MAG: tetratricopeptide repeat protein [Bacteroidota bacterium]